MNRKALLALLLTPGMAHAVICKSVDAEGVVSYSDVPASECRTRVNLPPSSTYAPRELPKTVTVPPGPPQSAAPKAFAGYESINIVQPEVDGTVRSNEGNVTVVVGTQPDLQPGHRVKLFIDGGAVPGEFDGNVIDLQGVNRGTHSLRAVVSDEKGRRQGESPRIRFTLRKVGLYDQERMKDKKPGEPKPEQPIEPTPEQPIAPSPENPIERPRPVVLPGVESSIPADRSPSSSAPSGTNPAFSPNYGRK